MTGDDARAISLERSPFGAVIATPAYRLVVRYDGPRAVLASPDGRVWSELSLIAGVDRPDRVDESTALRTVEVAELASGEVAIALETESSAWDSHRTTLLCTANDIRLSVSVSGPGSIADVTVFGGRAILASGAAGTFRSSTLFASVFVPTPTEPVQVVRPASSSAEIGVVGDAEPGRLHGIFSPPPLCFAFGREPVRDPTALPAGEWLAASVVAEVGRLGFTSLRYEPLDGGFLFRLAFEGHTRVGEAGWTSPEFVLRPAGSPLGAIAAYRDELEARGFAPRPGVHPAWFDEPIFCGWGAQCAHAVALTKAGLDLGAGGADGFVLPAGAAAAPEFARQELYDGWLARLEARGLRPGTIVIDDRWQAEYGLNTTDTDKWPDLRGWIAERHAHGQRVLLWFKAWDPGGLPAELCVRDAAGNAVAVDPGNPDYRAELTRQVTDLISAGGLDADGFKVDFTQRTPSGSSLTAYDEGDGGAWGVAALHLLIRTIHDAAKAAKPDALIVTHTVHPSFGDVADMIRLNDVLEYDPAGVRVHVAEQLRFRFEIARASLPEHPIDTDQWPMPNRREWLDYAGLQVDLGVPALYYVDSIDNSGETISDHDLDEIARTWRRYRKSKGR